MPPPDARAIGVGAGVDGGAPRGALDRLGLFQAVVLLDVLWNVLFVAVAAAVLVASVTESPAIHLRFWLTATCSGASCTFSASSSSTGAAARRPVLLGLGLGSTSSEGLQRCRRRSSLQ
jgi:hypothetical protein